VSNFVVQALKNQDITVYGDGGQTRSFCYVDDLVDGLVRLMGTPHDVTGPVNLGNPGEFTIRELAQTIIDMTGSSSRIVYMPLPMDDPKQRRPDVSLADELLRWRPAVALGEGLLKTVGYFERLLGELRPPPSPRQAAT
jgi:UDP-glucuronate decarboxylase